MKKKITKITGLISVIMTIAAILATDTVFAIQPFTGPYDQYYPEREIICPPRTPGDDSNPEYDLDYTSGTYKYNFVITFMSEGYKRVSSDYIRVFPREAETVYFGTPAVTVCENCAGRYSDNSIFTPRIFIVDDSGRELISRPGTVLTRSDIASISLADPVRIGIELTIDPKEMCPVCNRHIGDLIVVNGLFYTKKILEISSHPESVTVDQGQSAVFTAAVSKYRGTYGGPMDYYRWMMYKNGAWSEVTNGQAPGGEVYSGADTLRLTVSNVGSDMSGVKYACAFKGISDKLWKTRSATLTVNSPAITPVVTPAPSPTASPSPTGTVIKPGGGGSTEYKPSASSSAYLPPANASSSSSVKPQQTSSTGHVKDGTSEYNGTINPGGKTGPGSTVLPADDPLPSISGNGSGTSNFRPGRGGSSTAGGMSSSSQSSTTGKGPGTIMKNGVLYIVDDDTKAVGTGPGIGDGSAPDIEDVESDEAYTASDLAGSRQLREQNLKKGFFDTPYGYIVIALIALLILLLALFFLFFGVIVLGEAEEHDEVFEICSLRIMKRRDGKWCVNLGTAFDDNAVLKLRIGLLFAVIFDGWDMTGEVYGMYEGDIEAGVEQGVLLYRKNIRRSL